MSRVYTEYHPKHKYVTFQGMLESLSAGRCMIWSKYNKVEGSTPLQLVGSVRAQGVPPGVKHDNSDNPAPTPEGGNCRK